MRIIGIDPFGDSTVYYKARCSDRKVRSLVIENKTATLYDRSIGDPKVIAEVAHTCDPINFSLLKVQINIMLQDNNWKGGMVKCEQ